MLLTILPLLLAALSTIATPVSPGSISHPLPPGSNPNNQPKQNITCYAPEQGASKASLTYATKWWRKLESQPVPHVTIGAFECDKRFWCERGREIAVTWCNDDDKPRTMAYKNVREGIETVRDKCHFMKEGKEIAMGVVDYPDEWRLEVRRANKKENCEEGINPLANSIAA
ncbi:hypothetical protein BDV06DRAFT_226847 [Aspergillus oleicola]